MSTIELLAYLATKFDQARLLVLATYRPSELLVGKHPFLSVKLDLEARGLGRELPVPFLTQEHVERYLALEFPHHRFPATFPALIHARTEGSPLFMVDVLPYLCDRGVLVQEDGGWTLTQVVPEIERELPASVRSMIERKIDQLADADRRLLVGASVQGYEFDAAVVAEALDLDVAEVEERLQQLDRVHAFVRRIGEREFPDRTLTVRYRFVHQLYQNALYAALTPTRRATVSGRVAQALIGHHGETAPAVANDVAVLCEAARDFARASQYFQLAAQNAARVLAYHEAVVLAQRGLQLLSAVPESLARARQELDLQATLGPAFMATKGIAAPEVEVTFARAWELCGQVGRTDKLLPVLGGLCAFYIGRAEWEKAEELGNELLTMAQRPARPGAASTRPQRAWRVLLGSGTGPSCPYPLGGRDCALRSSATQLAYVPLWDGPWSHVPVPRCYRPVVSRLSGPGVGENARGAHAGSRALAALHIGCGFVLCRGASCLSPRGPGGARARDVVALSTDQGFPFWLAWGTIWAGAAAVQSGQQGDGIAQIEQGIAAYRAISGEMGLGWTTCLGLLAEAYGAAGRTPEGLALVTEALATARKTGERYWEVELHRLRGELLLSLAGTQGAEGSLQMAASRRQKAVGRRQEAVERKRKARSDPLSRDRVSEAEVSFREAIDIARTQQAKVWELRAVTSLSRLLLEQGRRQEARDMLAEIYAWFTEGFDTRDLQEAKALLEELS